MDTVFRRRTQGLGLRNQKMSLIYWQEDVIEQFARQFVFKLLVELEKQF